MSNKEKQFAEKINTALKSGDTTRPIIGRDAYAPKAGKGDKTAKTLTALVKEAEGNAAQSRENMLSSNSNANNAADSCKRAIEAQYQSASHAEKAQNCAEIAILGAVASVASLVATIIIIGYHANI